MLIPTPGPSGWYPISFAGLVWNHYILLLKIHRTDGSSTMKKHQMPLPAWRSGRFLHSEQRRCGDQWHLCCPKSYEFGHRKWRKLKTCGSGVPNLLRHELNQLNSWQPIFFKAFLDFWISLLTFHLRNRLFGWISGGWYVPKLDTVSNSGFFTGTKRVRVETKFIPTYSSTWWLEKQDHVTQYQYAAAKNVGWHGAVLLPPGCAYKVPYWKIWNPPENLPKWTEWTLIKAPTSVSMLHFWCPWNEGSPHGNNGLLNDLGDKNMSI